MTRHHHHPIGPVLAAGAVGAAALAWTEWVRRRTADAMTALSEDVHGHLADLNGNQKAQAQAHNALVNAASTQGAVLNHNLDVLREVVSPIQAAVFPPRVDEGPKESD